jgi:hypothetical protein
MTTMRRGMLAALVVGSMAGGALGATVINAASSSAATTSTPANNAAPQNAPSGGPPGSGKFVPNENPAHEKAESAQREAQENAGQFPTVR